ncbi:hypothetical protein [Curtobacterium flaccumfaciens]|uniref:hypothetical protein n=1 Tax=Curtobacterium flaccumfaciens TaxID=2035 RepID=UPI00188CEF6D|nr:hypothetical protein [Curtobacterium flaccumfaciens]MBF4628929.1 hypothetical protein [Curtobacterium flaccumfaciens]
MPSAVMRRADQITTTDVVLDSRKEPWSVHSVHHSDCAVTLTVRNERGEWALWTLGFAAWVSLPAVETLARFRMRVALRGVPWIFAAVLMALWAHVIGAPAFGGQVPVIVCLFAVAAVRMATTPEQDR